MYLGANKYPEFDGKDKKFISGCIKYAYKKEKLGRRFWAFMALLIGFTFVWGRWIDNLFPSNWEIIVDILFTVICMCIFLGYILYEVNNKMHLAVKKHISEFEHNNSFNPDGANNAPPG